MLPVENVVDIIKELIKLTKSHTIAWSLTKADNEGKKWYNQKNDTYTTKVNDTTFLVSSGTRTAIVINDMVALHRNIDDNPKEYHEYLRNLNTKPLNQLLDAINFKPTIDIIKLDDILAELRYKS